MSIKYFPTSSKSKLFLITTVFCFFTFAQVYAGQGGSTIPTATSSQAFSQQTDRIIIKFKKTSSMGHSASMSKLELNQLSQRGGLGLRHIRQLATGAQLLKIEKQLAKDKISDLISSLMTESNVEYAEPDIKMYPLAVPNDSRYNEQWQYFETLGGLNLPLAWDTSQGLGVVVAVIDTGYLPHADLAGNLLSGYDMISDTFVAQDGDGRDANAIDNGDWAPAGACYNGSPSSSSSWHGTHVAGSIAAVTNNSLGVSGVAYKAKVLPVRVLGRCGGYMSDIADGIIWAAGGTVSGVPANVNPAQVLNLSLGGSGSCGFTSQNAINTARNLGATVVVAAGNEKTNASNSNPANCTGVVVVAATNRDGKLANYSNFGSVVDVSAPGGEMSTGTANGILSTLNTGRTTSGSDSYAFYQGTSMATPHVAGVAALLYQIKPALTPDQVESTLKATARIFPSGCNQCGAGIVDAAAALSSLGDTTPPPATDNVLENGIAATNLSASADQVLRFTFEVPADSTNLSFVMSAGTGDADLYVKYGSEPSLGSYDCRPYLNGNSETCNISNVQVGTYHVMIHAYASFSGVSLLASFDKASNTSAFPKTDLSASTGAWLHYTLNVPTGMSVLNASISGGSGDADLYVRYGAEPTTTVYNCRPYKNGNVESCTIANPTAGTWYISLRAYSNFSGVTLDANYAQ